MRVTLRHYILAGLIFAAIASAQKQDDGTVGFGIQDNHQARTSPFQTGTADPATCSATTHEFFYRTDTHILKECTATNTWTAVPVGASNHALLSNLSFATSGHTGFASSSHAATHKLGGSDPLTSVTAAPNGVPQADTTGVISSAWLPPFVGATGSAGGVKGAVPTPGATDNNNCLHGDGTWGGCGSTDLLTYLTQKGSLITMDGTALAGQDPGTTGQVLSADSSSDTGLRWGTLVFNQDEVMGLANNQNGSCATGDHVSFVTPNNPVCTIGTGSTAPHTWAYLLFADSALKCVTLYTTVPNSWSGGQVDLRLKWVNVDGGFGVNSGGVCVPDSGHSNQQQCMKLSAQTAFFPDGTSAAVPSYNSAKLSDVMPARTTNNEFTGAIRGLDMTGAASRIGMRILLCRDARSTNGNCTEATSSTTPCDSIAGSIGIMKAIINWPTVVVAQ